MVQAIRAARETFRAADNSAGSLASALQGRLRHVPAYVLSQLKKELAQFNSKKGTWKS